MILVKDIEPDSLAFRAGFQSGDRILSINGEEIRDLIDFRVHSSESQLSFEVERSGDAYIVDVERISGEDVGISFDEMPLRRCNNKCVFCFLHQMPPGLRRSLYFEDDDYRLSFLHGSYVTLTNIKDDDINRIIHQGLSPQYISVHATDPTLRQELLGRKKPTVPILDRIEQLATNNIEMHAQVVVCPGLNDGQHLERTLSDLWGFYPSVRSVAVVPVGLTRFRSHLPDLQPVTPVIAVEYIDFLEAWGQRCNNEMGERFVYPADELFLLSSKPLPPCIYYDSFPQIENGVGMVRKFQDCWRENKRTLRSKCEKSIQVSVVTGMLAQPILEPIVRELAAITGIDAKVLPVKNNFFGHGITVSGLLTGQDIVGSINETKQNVVILPPNCINGDGLTLDGMTVDEIEEASGVTITVGDYNFAKSVEGIVNNQFFSSQDFRSKGDGRQLSEHGFFVDGNDSGDGNELS